MSNLESAALIKYFELTAQEVANHHKALWEEEKHYTWWVYILFAAIGYLYVNPDIFGFGKTFPIFFLAGFGIWVSILGNKVIKREGRQFYEARRKFIKAAKGLNLGTAGQTDWFDDFENTKTFLLENNELHQAADELCPSNKTKGISIRALFRWNFIVTKIIFICISFVSLTLSCAYLFLPLTHFHRFVR